MRNLVWLNYLLFHCHQRCQGPGWLPDCWKEYECSNLCSPFSVFSILHALMAYILAWNTMVWNSQLQLWPFLTLIYYTPASRSFLVLDLSVNQTRNVLLSRLNPFCHSLLSGNLIVSGLSYALSWKYPVRPHLLDGLMLHILRFFGVTVLVDLSFHCWVNVSLQIPTWASSLCTTWRGESRRSISVATVGVFVIIPVSQSL